MSTPNNETAAFPPGSNHSMSLVAQHASLQQASSELSAVSRLLHLGFGPVTVRAALELTAWVDDDAQDLLNEFRKFERMNVRSTRATGSTQKDTMKTHKSADDDADRNMSDSSDHDQDDEERRRRRRRRKREKEDERRARRDEKKERKKRKKEEKEEERRKKKKKTSSRGGGGGGGGGGYGSRGVIREEDVRLGGSKHGEFVTWCLEIRGVAVENMPSYEERNLARSFCEDYNTCTLPSEKFYDLDAWQRDRAHDAATNDDENAHGSVRLSLYISLTIVSLYMHVYVAS